MDITKISAYETWKLITKKEISVVEVNKAYLKNYEKYNGKINAVCTLAENILEEAAKKDDEIHKNKPLALHGLPVGIKDITVTANLRTTYGCTLYKDNIPQEDALVVQRLKKAGAIIFGKTNTPEFATGGNTFNDVFGATKNPWNIEKSAGGSTGGGAAALATGMISLAEGTDLGGSLRIPASFCGIVGLRPSLGLVPHYPSPYLWDDLQMTGPMARTAEDIAIMLQAIAGPTPLCPLRQSVKDRNFLETVLQGIPEGTRIAYCSDITNIGIEQEVEKLCREAAFSLKDKKINISEIDLDLSFARSAFLHLRGEWMVTQQYDNLQRREKLGTNLKGNVEAGLKISTEDLAQANIARSKLWLLFAKLFEEYDYILTPCMAVSPFPVTQNYPTTIAGKEMKTYIDWVAPTFTLSLTTLPIVSVPCGLTSNNLPVGMQIIAKPESDEYALALAKVIQEMHPIGLPNLE